jgi:ABC-type transport system involved in multi-copper enzyme maturation permease subunit
MLAHRSGTWDAAAVEKYWEHDLPERFGPMTVKELRQNLRRGSFVYPFLGIQFLAVIAMVAEFQMGEVEKYTEYVGMMNLSLLGISGPFWMVVTAICMLIMPLGGLILMGQELEEGNHELLLLTHLDRWKVVFGKFFTLWGLCALTFISLMPYVVVRYLLGSIEWWREASCSLSILGGSAILCAGAIGASSFRGLGARIGIMLLFILSCGAACSVPLGASAMQTKSCGVWYHLSAIASVFCYTLLGLTLARSRLRLVVHAYEVKPSWMIVGLLVFTPFVVWMTTAFTAGYAGCVGLIGMAFVAIYADVTPKAPKWMTAPAPNVPKTEG